MIGTLEQETDERVGIKFNSIGFDWHVVASRRYGRGKYKA
jgi:hypothetical protein